MDGPTAEREVVALDLPCFGRTPRLRDEEAIAALADALGAFVTRQGVADAAIVIGSRLSSSCSPAATTADRRPSGHRSP